MNTPTSIKISSAITLIVAILALFASYVLLGLSGFGRPGFNEGHLGVIIGIAFAATSLLAGIAIYRGRNWARIVLLVLTSMWGVFWSKQMVNHPADALNLLFLFPGCLVFLLLLLSFFQNNCKSFFKDNN